MDLLAEDHLQGQNILFLCHCIIPCTLPSEHMPLEAPQNHYGSRDVIACAPRKHILPGHMPYAYPTSQHKKILPSPSFYS
jgi:hypothetical protein